MGWHHEDLTAAVGGAPNADVNTGGLAGYTWDLDQTQHVVYRGVDGHVHDLRFHHGDGWAHTDLTAAAGAPAIGAGPLAAHTWDVDGTQHVFYGGDDRHVHELWFNHTDGWNHADLTAVAKAPTIDGGLACHTWDVDQTQHVFYPSAANGHMNELWFHHGNGWNHADLTAASKSQPFTVGSRPASYTWGVDKSQQVVSVGADRHVHELRFRHGEGWQHTDLTDKAGRQFATSPPVGYTWDVDQTRHVVHTGIDGHIHDLWFNQRDGWNHNDATLDSGGVPAGIELAAYTWDVDQTQHVIYQGRDGGLHELWFHHGDGWNYENLFTASGGVASVQGGEMAGYTFGVDKTQHVIYRGLDGHVHELWFSHSM